MIIYIYKMHVNAQKQISAVENEEKKDGVNQKTRSIFCTTAKWVKGSEAGSSGKTPLKVKTYIKQSSFV